MCKIAGMASNRGRNLRHIDDRSPGGAELSVVLTNHEDAPVLEAAAARGVPTEVVTRSADESRVDHERRIIDRLSRYDVDLVCLDGYMRVLTDEFIDAMPPIFNVHPSLLPAFPGANAHRDVLDAGVKVSGCTVHVVTEDVDAGPIVTQETVPVYEDDDETSLKRRVLERAEYTAYPRAVRWFAEGRLTVDLAEETVEIDGDTGGSYPQRRILTNDRRARLRYGENHHQDAAVYEDPACSEANVVHAEQLNEGAKALSYNNYNDADAALDLIKEFDRPAAAVIKHANPAGCAVADSIADAYDRALATDPKSAFGGIVALNRECDVETADSIVDSFKEVVVAPGYTDAAIEVLSETDDLRVLDVGPIGDPTETVAEKPIVGGRLIQDRDLLTVTAAELDVVTDRKPTDEEIETMLFAWRTVKHAKSNAIVFADRTETVGLGVGQVSRVDAVELAARKADRDAEGKSAEGSIMASDAFFPFPDGVEAAAAAGVDGVIQPGGSVNDEDVIAAADDLGLTMAFTGSRCFRHD